MPWRRPEGCVAWTETSEKPFKSDCMLEWGLEGEEWSKGIPGIVLGFCLTDAGNHRCFTQTEQVL